jgi:hypothetical protein
VFRACDSMGGTPGVVTQVNAFGVKAADLDAEHIFSYDQCNVMAPVGGFAMGPMCDMAYVVPRAMADVAFSAVKVPRSPLVSLHRRRCPLASFPSRVATLSLPVAEPPRRFDDWAYIAPGREQQSVATPQAASGWARPPCSHIKNQSCRCLGLLSRWLLSRI